MKKGMMMVIANDKLIEPSQGEMILEYLKKGYSLTPLEALKMFGCFRLGARIWELKQRGYNIEMQLCEVIGGKHVAEYRMKAQSAESQEPTSPKSSPTSSEPSPLQEKALSQGEDIISTAINESEKWNG